MVYKEFYTSRVITTQTELTNKFASFSIVWHSANKALAFEVAASSEEFPEVVKLSVGHELLLVVLNVRLLFIGQTL